MLNSSFPVGNTPTVNHTVVKWKCVVRESCASHVQNWMQSFKKEAEARRSVERYFC